MKFHALLLTALTALVPATAFAQLGGPVADPVRYSVMLNHPATQPAQLKIQANDNIRDIDLVINFCGKDPVRQHIKSIARGDSYDLTWNQPAGNYNCQLNMQGKDSNGNVWKSNGNFQMNSAMHLGINTEILGLSADINELTWHTTRPVVRASLVITAEDGTQIDNIVQDLKPAQKDLKMTWKKSDKKPAIVELRVDDDQGSWSTNTIVSISIPHEDVVFDTGKSNIRKDQENKLLATLDSINKVRDQYDRVMMNLYITGYTDTVGSTESNDKLSRERAQSIAAWIKRHGLKVDTYYRGLGERVLFTKTADETPEESNRRVTYVLTNVMPSDFTDIPTGQWKKI